MKRSAAVAAVIALLAVSYTGASWYVGKRAQTTVEELVHQANDRMAKALGADLSGTGVKLAISEYKRHVFSSDILYTLQFNEPNGKPGEYLLSDHLQHGPFPVGAIRQGDFIPSLAVSNVQLIPSAVTKKWFDSLKGESPVMARTRIGFMGAGESTWNFKPLNIVDRGQTTKFSGGTVDISVYNDFRDSEANGQFDSFSLLSAASGESLELKGIKINSKTSFPEGQISQVQSTTASADHLTLSMPGAATIRAEDIAAELNSRQQGSLLQGSLRYDFGRIHIGEANMGSLAVGIKGKDFDVKAITALAMEYDRILDRHRDDDEITLSAQESASLQEKLIAMLATNPTVSIEPLTWRNDQGESSLALTVNLKGLPAAVGNTELSVDMLLLHLVHGLSLDVIISKPMFVKAFGQLHEGARVSPGTNAVSSAIYDQYSDRLAVLGLARIDGDKTISAIKYSATGINANGRNMSIAEFIQRVFGLFM